MLLQLRESELEQENAALARQRDELQDEVARLNREKDSLHDVSMQHDAQIFSVHNSKQILSTTDPVSTAMNSGHSKADHTGAPLCHL